MTDDSDIATFATARTININGLLWAGKWRSAVAEYQKLAEEVAAMGETLPGGLLDGSLPNGHATSTRIPEQPVAQLLPPGSVDRGDLSGDAMQNSAALVQCGMGAHAFGAPDSNGWRTCAHCGQVNVTPG